MQQQRSIGWGRNRGLDQPSHPAANGENGNQKQYGQRAQGSSVEAFSECHKVARVQGRKSRMDVAKRAVLRALFSLQRPEEIDDFLLLLSAQPIETFDDLICLAARALVISDGIDQVARSSVMEEEDALSDAPEGSGSELVGAGAALRDAVGEVFAHMVDEKVGEKIRRLIGKRSTRAGRGAARNHCARGKRGCMTVRTAYLYKSAAPLLARRCGGSGSRRRQHPHEVGKRFDV